VALKKWIIGTTVGVVVVAGVGFAIVWVNAPVDTFGKVDFDDELAIPPLAESDVDADGRRVFELTAQEGRTQFGDDSELTTWGFNGTYLGPTLRAERGEDVVVNVNNALDEDTTVHWHGMHLPANMDGGPHQMIEPDHTWSPTWTIDQEAATLWYHPHPHGETREHVTRGLAGMFILDDPDNPTADAMPHDYGVDDIPLIVQDRRLSRSGEINTGNDGDKILVNGTLGPYLDVTTEAVRFRLLNGSAKRVYNFGFSDDRTFSVVGSDGGLLPSPVETDRLLLSPGERAEIVVTMSPGDDVVLRSYPADLGGVPIISRFQGESDQFDILQLRADENLVPSAGLPDSLAEAPDVLGDDAGNAVVNRRFELSGNRINGEKMDMARIDEVVEVDTTEVWEVENTDGEFHNFHVHDVQFQVLDINGEPPAPEIAGWKDTVFLAPSDTARIAMRFSDYTNPDFPYMFHCHRLRHEDRGMMGQFVVVETGQDPGEPPDHSH
jgi:FtsP/CotA-like multicopper oxidase with cupredoxin domain